MQGFPPWAAATLKWVVAVAAMAVIVLYAAPRALEELSQAVSFGSDLLPEVPEPTPTAEAEAAPATSSGEARARGAAGVRNAVVHTAGTQTVTLSADGADELLVAFEPLPADPACLTQVELEVQLVESTETEVFVRPARVADLVVMEEGQPLPADAAVDGGQPSRAYTSGAPGRLRWNATIPYSIAAREAEPGADVVFSIFLPPGHEAVTTFASTGGDEPSAASLAWTAVAGCVDLEPGGEPDAEEPEQET